ncbi:hypothetical protein ABKV19_014782 [Rosa sericea]
MEVVDLNTEWSRWSLRQRLKNFPRLLLLDIKDFLRVMSPTLICFSLLVLLFESCVRTYWEGLDSITSHVLVEMGSKCSFYSILAPLDQQIHNRVTLNLTTFASLLFADLPYFLAYVDFELRPSLFTARGLISFIICCLTVVDIYVFNGHSQHYLQMRLYTQLYWPSCLRFLVFFGLIVVGGANMIEKAWHGDLVFHKHVLIPLSLCVFAFIRLHDRYHRLRRMWKRAMIVMPVEEKDE